MYCAWSAPAFSDEITFPTVIEMVSFYYILGDRISIAFSIYLARNIRVQFNKKYCKYFIVRAISMWNTFAAVEALPMKLGQKEKQENVTVMNFLAHHLWPLQKASKLIVQWDEHVRIVTKNKKRQLISLLQKSTVLLC